MARQLRVEYEGAIYHITVRSNGKEDLFADDADRVYLLRRLKESAEQHAVRVFLFCLMRNHFHLVVETLKGNLGRFMQSLLTGYTVYFNLRHRRHGHVTQGRYGARLVEGDAYLMKLSRYVHLNPVQVRGVSGKPFAERLAVLRGHRWSSYPGYSGLGARFDLVSEGPMLALVDGKGEAGRVAYREFVEDGLRESDEAFAVEMWRSPRSIGGEKFREWVDSLYTDKVQRHGRPEDVAFRVMSGKRLSVLQVEEVVARVCGVGVADLAAHRRSCWVKGLAGLMLVKYANLTQREASGRLGLATGAGVSYQIRKLHRQMHVSAELRRQIVKATKALETLSERT
jgi:REP element-mobilizing transposase RayT